MALAVTVTLTQCVDRDVVFNTMIQKVPAKVADVNKRAFELGEKYANEALRKGC